MTAASTCSLLAGRGALLKSGLLDAPNTRAECQLVQLVAMPTWLLGPQAGLGGAWSISIGRQFAHWQQCLVTWGRVLHVYSSKFKFAAAPISDELTTCYVLVVEFWDFSPASAFDFSPR